MGRAQGWFSYGPAPSRMPRAYASYTELSSPTEPPQREGPELADLRRLVRRAVRGTVSYARAPERPTLGSILTDHLGLGGASGGAVEAVPVSAREWAAYEHVNVQVGLDAWLAEHEGAVRTVGVVGFQHRDFGLAELLTSQDGYGLGPGSVARVALPSGPGGQTVSCVRCALFLLTEEHRRTALLLRGGDSEMGRPSITLEAASTDPDAGEETLAELDRLVNQHNVFRRQVLSFGGDVFGPASILHFHERPTTTRRDLVLDAATIGAIEQQVVGVARHRQRLLGAGQHLKRGILLYGPPGVGKTHTVRYLTSTLGDTTVIQVTGEALQLIRQACQVARSLQPSLVVVEDVDLIAEERGMEPGMHPLLFQLLNEMDGLEEDADVAFVLTTNRADLLEPALAARPGRVDQAVELRLPDRAARRQLFDLYRGDLQLDLPEAELEAALERCAGVTASFLKELLRRTALHAAERSSGDGSLTVTGPDLTAALDELLDSRNRMTRALLGSAGADPSEAGGGPEDRTGPV
ncbi:MAG TPA: ATP-binding protein [Segeticoccus sp.]|uniref:ATP-binding protein n=1 Tax=Segeticoccus sp. TaxID=2706531 RepID=UPI002D808A6F|nr:ATP-binding protein [Segeticoccus sp.]HET8599996.1 ATP-binding protein [Segeticoccus sp.]